METSLRKSRAQKIVKSNELIQKHRFNLSLMEQKIILYLISKIKPEDTELVDQKIEIVDFYKVCGIDNDSGANYKNIKDAIKKLSDKSLWVAVDGETETLMRWINKAWINKKSGTIRIRLDDDLKPHLIQLREKYTQYELYYVIAMRSQYSPPLFELLKSYAYADRPVPINIDWLQRKLSAENYSRFPDFKRRVLDKAVEEINTLTDIRVTYELEKRGNKAVSVAFTIRQIDKAERLATMENIEKRLFPKALPGQIRLEDDEALS